MVENPIRTCSPYPSPANNKQPAPLRDVRVVDLVLPINLPLRAASEASRSRARENTMMSLSSLDADGDLDAGGKKPEDVKYT